MNDIEIDYRDDGTARVVWRFADDIGDYGSNTKEFTLDTDHFKLLWAALDDAQATDPNLQEYYEEKV